MLVLLLAGGLWWSTRPKIDPRLVGTWESVATPGYFTTYFADGTYFIHSDVDAVATPKWRWQVYGDRLYENRPAITFRDSLSDAFTTAVNRITGRTPLFENRPSIILEVTEDVFRLHCYAKTFHEPEEADYEYRRVRTKEPG